MRALLGPVALLCISLAVGFVALRDRSAHVTFPLRADGQYAISRDFSGTAGLYVITLEMDAIKDRHHTSCLLGGDLQPYPSPTGTVGIEGCDVRPVGPPRWRLSSGGEVVARDSDPGAMLGVLPIARGERRIERELGSVRLNDRQSYRLEVGAASRLLSGTRAVIHLRLHPWDVKKGLGMMALGLFAALLFAAGGIVWLVKVVRPPRTAVAR